MTISHQTVLGKDGKPFAALIPWDEFELIRERLADGDDGTEVGDEWRAEIRRRAEDIDAGRTKLIPHEEVMTGVRAKLEEVRRGKQDV